ncbi:hypothetical protein AAFF_G00281400 [Aldrovandia affinis]|uniref:Uncharacterized protein n=1 Tax=Aldrovandia affinis TaxID=143900 RepID=A0AAD7RA25_9TELE|nr:hypothetical protein AAFF_G00281400 [Aldrovandia affinis]
MFTHLVEQIWAVSAVLLDRTVTKPSDARNLELWIEYWRSMEEITPVLKSLEVATTATCGERAVSLSVVYPVVCSLMDEHLLPSEENSISFNTFVNAVRKSLKDQFKPSDRETGAHSALVTSVLDPRHKKLKFIASDIQVAARPLPAGKDTDR